MLHNHLTLYIRDEGTVLRWLDLELSTLTVLLKYSEKQIICKQPHTILSRDSSLFTHAADCSKQFGNAENPDVWAGGGASNFLPKSKFFFQATIWSFYSSDCRWGLSSTFLHIWGPKKKKKYLQKLFEWSCILENFSSFLVGNVCIFFSFVRTFLGGVCWVNLWGKCNFF